MNDRPAADGNADLEQKGETLVQLELESGKWNSDPTEKLRRELWLARKELVSAGRAVNAAQRAAIAAQQAARHARRSQVAAWCALVVTLAAVGMALFA